MRADVAHLLRRAGFGGRAEEIDAAERAGYEATVDALITAADAPDPGADATPPPRFAPVHPGRGLAGRQRANQLREEQSARLTAWWLDRMATASSPLAEKRTWFWHGHWATSVQKVRSAPLMLQQNQTLRRLGGGDFLSLAAAMVQDPALAIWLDEVGSTAKAPNENLARELMELFTLGVGHYGEPDVRQAARALTGWSLDRTGSRLVFSPSAFDNGTKTILGAQGDFGSTGLINLLVCQPECADWVVSRLWNRFAAPGPVPGPVQARLLTAYGPRRDLRELLGPAARPGLPRRRRTWGSGEAAGRVAGGPGARAWPHRTYGLRSGPGPSTDHVAQTWPGPLRSAQRGGLAFGQRLAHGSRSTSPTGLRPVGGDGR